MNSSRTDATFLHRMFRSWRFPAHHFVRWVIPTLRGTLFCAFSGALLFMHGQVALAQTEKVLYSFCAKFNCADGSDPVGSLILDGEGNFYGTTAAGGIVGSLCQSFGCGTVFEWTASGTLKTLYNFSSAPDGEDPMGGLARDSKGNLYGTTAYGRKRLWRCL